MEELISLVFKTYGLVGLILASPFAVLIFLWKDYRRISLKLSAIEASRVEDAQKISWKLIEMVEEQSGLNKETNLTLNRIGDLLSSPPNRHDSRG